MTLNIELTKGHFVAKWLGHQTPCEKFRDWITPLSSPVGILRGHPCAVSDTECALKVQQLLLGQACYALEDTEQS